MSRIGAISELRSKGHVRSTSQQQKFVGVTLLHMNSQKGLGTQNDCVVVLHPMDNPTASVVMKPQAVRKSQPLLCS